MSDILLKIVIICIVFYIFNQTSMIVLALINRNQIKACTDKYYDCRWSLRLSTSLCEPMVYRYFTQFNPGGIAFFIVRTIHLAMMNKVGIFEALYVQTKFDKLFLNITDENFRETNKKLIKIIGE